MIHKNHPADCEGCKVCQGTCSCSHHRAVPVLLVLISILFLLGAQGYVSAYTVHNVWPMLLGIIGIVKLLETDCKCC